MSWSSLASNQMVSFTDSQTSPFSLNPGQTVPTSNQCMTKDDALTKWSLDSSYMSSYTSNQLVPKSVWVAVQITYTYYGSLYAQNPCDPMVYIYYGSNGQWYQDIGGTFYNFNYACQYGYYDEGYMAYLYYMYYFEPSNPTPVYWGQTTSQCAPF